MDSLHDRIFEGCLFLHLFFAVHELAASFDLIETLSLDEKQFHRYNVLS